MNHSLLQPFTPEDVIAAFHDIGTRKAPGIDGFPSSFFRLHWETIGSEFIQLCLALLDGSADMAQVNRTVIVLIPKVTNPEFMRQFCPINLRTVIYKTVSKVLVNRMKPLLSQCISPNQSAFFAGRNITDNILLAHEIVHSLTSVGTGPYRGAAFKLDIEKTFDTVEWNFVHDVMLRMGLLMDGLILSCVVFLRFLFQSELMALSTLLNADCSQGGLIGLCAICSAYSFLQRPPAPINRPPKFWKLLASLYLPPKVRVFVWRAAHHALPMGDRLLQAQLSTGLCPFCLNVVETPTHALRDCPHAWHTLLLAGFDTTFLGSSLTNVREWLELGSTTLPADLFLLLLVLSWNIWNSRNDFVHNSHFQPPWLLVLNSETLLRDYLCHNSVI
ncbi:hypothetical protein GQ457_13G012490 [Hibiscus cannabinus]